jgi:hypothetical protein
MTIISIIRNQGQIWHGRVRMLFRIRALLDDELTMLLREVIDWEFLFVSTRPSIVVTKR